MAYAAGLGPVGGDTVGVRIPPPALTGPGPAAGPSIAALVTLTIPWATYRGQSEVPGQTDGFGPLDGDDARDLAAAAARHPRTRWYVTALNPTAPPPPPLPGGLDFPRPRGHGIQQPGRHLPGLPSAASITQQSKQHTRPPLHIT